MAQATRKTGVEGFAGLGPLGKGAREAVFICLTAAAVYLFISIASYSPADPGWSYSDSVGQVVNRGGVVGAWVADVSLYLFGYLAYLFPMLVGYGAWLAYRDSNDPHGLNLYIMTARAGGFLLTMSAGAGICTLHFLNRSALPLDAGGILGDLVGSSLAEGFGDLGGTLILLALFLTGVTLFTGLSWLWLMDTTGKYTLLLIDYLFDAVKKMRDRYQGARNKKERDVVVKEKRKKKIAQPKPRIEPVLTTLEPSVRIEKEKQVPLFEPSGDETLPALSLLDEPKQTVKGFSEAALEAMSRQVELKLADFGIEVQVSAVHPGPVITRFEMQPAPGVKVSRISNLAKDLARSLSTISVRIVEVIPGKSVIGLEIPNESREIVYLSEILRSKHYDRVSSPLTLGLGKDIAGHPVVVDLAKMPHLLVAGTTGAGKSVAVNAMILSILYKAPASDVRMIMIDPKMLELSVYEGIPHLLAPVVTDMKEAANALRWCVAEMERRYQIMSSMGVRNIAGYNKKIKEAQARGEPINNPLHVPTEAEPSKPLEALPFIVVVVDELADMMMVVGKKVEELIARLAQKARASGIHLILATQRPSVDVITGLIKANIPSRIAFQVSSKVDSRTILDQMGAEQLLGQGDMLYLSAGMAVPNRVHGAFVGDHEVHNVVDNLKSTMGPHYDEAILDGGSEGSGEAAAGGAFDAGDAESDPLYDQAVAIVIETRKASVSGIQRRLKIGYNRAARMVEQMEAAGLVGALANNGSRDVLIPPPQE